MIGEGSAERCFGTSPPPQPPRALDLNAAKAISRRVGTGGLAGPSGAMDGVREPPRVKAHCSRGTASHTTERTAASGWTGAAGFTACPANPPVPTQRDTIAPLLAVAVAVGWQKTNPSTLPVLARAALAVDAEDVALDRAVAPARQVVEAHPHALHLHPVRQLHRQLVADDQRTCSGPLSGMSSRAS